MLVPLAMKRRPDEPFEDGGESLLDLFPGGTRESLRLSSKAGGGGKGELLFDLSPERESPRRLEW